MEDLAKMMEDLKSSLDKDLEQVEPKNKPDDIDLSFLEQDDPNLTSEFDYLDDMPYNKKSPQPLKPTNLPQVSGLASKMQGNFEKMEKDIKSGNVFDKNTNQTPVVQQPPKQENKTQPVTTVKLQDDTELMIQGLESQFTTKPATQPQSSNQSLKPQLKGQPLKNPNQQLKPQIPVSQQLKPQMKNTSQLKPQLKGQPLKNPNQQLKPQIPVSQQLKPQMKMTSQLKSTSQNFPIQEPEKKSRMSTSLAQLQNQTIVVKDTNELDLDSLLNEVQGAVLSEQSIEKLSKDLKEVPTWAIVKLRDEIERRIEIENIWESENRRIKESEKRLEEWQNRVAKAYVEELRERTQIIEQKDKEIQELKHEIEKLKRKIPQISPPPFSQPSKKIIEPSTSEGKMTFDKKNTTWMESQRFSILNELLFFPELELMTALVDSCILNPTLQEEATTALLVLVDEKNCFLNIFSVLIKQEVERTVTENTLFRTNSVGSKMMTTYSKILGMPYLQKLIAPILKEVAHNDENLELDPNKTTGLENVEQNLTKIENYAHRIIQTITLNMDSIPLQFREICSILQKEISVKFKDAISGIRNFIFLRYICPSILIPPAKFGLEMKKNAIRSFTLIGKVIQNVVNGAVFKEPFMQKLNDFVKSNNELITSFMRNLANPPSPNVVAEKFIRPFTSKEALRKIQNCISQQKDEIVKKLAAFDSTRYTQKILFIASDRMISTISNLGVPKKGKKLALVQNDPKTNDLISLIVQEPKICLELLDLTFSQKEGEKVLQSLLYVLSLNSPVQALNFSRDAMVKGLNAKPEITNDCQAFKVFSNYMNLVGSDFLREYIPSLYKSLVTEELKPNSDRLLDLTQNLLGQILQNTSDFPPVLSGLLMTTFHTLNGKISPQKACNEAFKLFCLGYLCPAIEGPEHYQLLAEVPKKKTKKSLSLIAELIVNISNPNPNIKDQKMVQFIMKKYETSSKLFLEFLTHPNSTPDWKVDISQIQVPNNFWNLEEESLRILHLNLVDSSEQMASRLGSTGVDKEVSFKISEFVDALIPVQETTNPSQGSKQNRNTSIF